MAKENSNGQPVLVLPKFFTWPGKFLSRVKSLIKTRKKIFIAVIIIIVALFLFNLGRPRKNNQTQAKTLNVAVEKSYEMSALNNQGKVAASKVRFSIISAEKTNSVLVKDQTYTAKNNKLFLIINLELKNDATYPVNIMPGDLIRLTYGNDGENKYAPDLHNNLVLVAAISTKNDRVGFVIPEEEKFFKLYIGELEGKKDEVPVNFPS